MFCKEAWKLDHEMLSDSNISCFVKSEIALFIHSVCLALAESRCFSIWLSEVEHAGTLAVLTLQSTAGTWA